MKKPLFIFLALVLVGIVAAFVWIFMSRNAADTDVTQKPVVFPESPMGETPDSGVAALFAGTQTYEDPVNPGYYYLGAPPAGPDATSIPPFVIEYIEATSYFNVSLTQEPIGENRKAAEAALKQALGASEDQLCHLNYTVSVPGYVNEQFSSMNLGFSFCPGSVRLP